MKNRREFVTKQKTWLKEVKFLTYTISKLLIASKLTPTCDMASCSDDGIFLRASCAASLALISKKFYSLTVPQHQEGTTSIIEVWNNIKGKPEVPSHVPKVVASQLKCFSVIAHEVLHAWKKNVSTTSLLLAFLFDL